MRVVSVVGARPQFVKASALHRAYTRHGIEELLVHTGQHYDPALSDVFFDELELPRPWHHLEVGAAPVPVQTGRMLERLCPVLKEADPDVVVVPGDTTSTLAGALAAAQLGYPVAHVEAGLRSFRRDMPEERNRVLADHLADVRYAPSRQAVAWLADEGIRDGVVRAGDVMRDVVDWHLQRDSQATAESTHDLADGAYVLATVHRPRNADDPARLSAILEALGQLAGDGIKTVLPLHPRTRKQLPAVPDGIAAVDPVGHAELLHLASRARAVVTDSGGLQKEAYWLGVPCVTLRAETEWIETVEEGWNVLVDADPTRIIEAVTTSARGSGSRDAYGQSGAAHRIATDLLKRFGA